MFDPLEEDPSYHPLAEDRPGGFDWGGQAGEGADPAANRPAPADEPVDNANQDM